jgi:hypothetical protein
LAVVGGLLHLVDPRWQQVVGGLRADPSALVRRTYRSDATTTEPST